MAMDDLLDQILNPTSSNADGLLSELGLAALPSRDEVHRQIETDLLLPKESLPSHWLPTYQLWVVSVRHYPIRR